MVVMTEAHGTPDLLRWLKFGANFWNVLRAEHPELTAINFDGVVLDGMILTGALHVPEPPKA
jgi:hypothetical protein